MGCQTSSAWPATASCTAPANSCRWCAGSSLAGHLPLGASQTYVAYLGDDLLEYLNDLDTEYMLKN